ncbi:hypothetical protein ACFVIN_31375, partial [Streptomyces prasinus]
ASRPTPTNTTKRAGGSVPGGSAGTSKSGGGDGGRKRPGVLGQLALDRSKRRSTREAAAQKERAREQKADRKRSTADSGGGSSSGSSPGTGTDRVTLGKALGDEARRRAEERLRRRREDPSPFIRRVPRDGAGAAEGTAATGPEGDSTETGEDGPQTDTSGPGTGWDYWEPPGDGRGPWSSRRRNPWDSLFDAMWDAQVVWTVERVDQPGDAAPRWEPAAIATAPAALSPASSAATTAGTTTATTPKETRVSASVPIPSPRTAGAASEHLTDVTLDDVLTALQESKSDCFATYDECAVLADKARELRDALAVLAVELAERHNVVGRLTSAAMARLSESMDVLARRAEAMRTESLRAAEAVEVAHDEMHDAYKPVQRAAADAGLTMPSARIHNED